MALIEDQPVGSPLQKLMVELQITIDETIDKVRDADDAQILYDQLDRCGAREVGFQLYDWIWAALHRQAMSIDPDRFRDQF